MLLGDKVYDEVHRFKVTFTSGRVRYLKISDVIRKFGQPFLWGLLRTPFVEITITIPDGRTYKIERV